MLVLRSTYDAVVQEREDAVRDTMALAARLKMSERLRTHTNDLFAELHAELATAREVLTAMDAQEAVLRAELANLQSHYDLCKKQYDARGEELIGIKAELAETWVRNRKGQLQRHPTYVAPVKTSDA